MKTPLILWLLGDGKPGHENQSLGLADALARQTVCEIHRISLSGVTGMIRRVKRALRIARGLPQPDIVIAAGHSTHFALLWLARKHRALSIVLMQPSLPRAWFGLCIAPDHDFTQTPDIPNLITSRGALNRVELGSQEKSSHLILIGGPSANHGWDAQNLLVCLEKITNRDSWRLTDSRRTPAGFLDEIRERFPTIEIFPHQGTTPDWLPKELATAAEVWVTEDSVSMIYEALSSGATVGLLPVPALGASRVQRGIEALVNDKFLTRFSDWEKSGELPPPRKPLREADRCASQVLTRFQSR